MIAEEYRRRKAEIEERANAELATARARFRLIIPEHRSARYSAGLRAAIIEMAIAGTRDEIDERMRAECEALDTEWLEQWTEDPCDS